MTIVSILRLKSLLKFGADSTNPTMDFYAVGIWSTVEITVGMICACLPSLRLLLAHLFPKIMGTTRHYVSKYGSNGLSGRRISRPFNASVVSQMEKAHVPDDRIACHRTFTVEYGDHDEAYLVCMREAHRKATKLGFKSSASFSS